MPNHCMNTLEITADTPAQMQAFIKKYFTFNKETNQQELNFEKVIPHPKSYKVCPKKYLEPNYDPSKPTGEDEYGCSINPWFNWYDFNVDNWGTKWNCYDCYFSLSEDKTNLIFDYNTAWAPADKVIEKLIKDNPKLRIENSYYEPGCCFCGKTSSFEDDTWYYEGDDQIDLMMKASELDFESKEGVYEEIMDMEDKTAQKFYLAKYFPETLEVKKSKKKEQKK